VRRLRLQPGDLAKLQAHLHELPIDREELRGPLMHYRELPPAPALRAYIRCYWTLQAPANSDAAPQRVLPDGCVEIVINLGARFIRCLPSGAEVQPHVLVIGPTTRHVTIAPTGHVRLIGIRFAPGGAFPFLSVPPRELRDEAPSLDDVAPPIEPDVIDQLATAAFAAEASILDRALGRRLARSRRLTDRRVAQAVDATFAARHPLPVDALVALTGLGPRQIERTFRANVGFGPKTLCRLARFQRVVRAIEPANRPSWAQLAAHHGYVDQSHLAREFREFAGTTLTAYANEMHPMSDLFHQVTGGEDSPLD
jgi:AraC-like DNA-binding protein